ncbi:MAG: GGDEF domain-containing protein [Desulfobacterales bacterium]|nr:GGDEF domain-containing protein [Desulfobacterales bacterium]MBF0397713.1 GGDEF domain-containing protein [Desulfobacterales bacterium]
MAQQIRNTIRNLAMAVNVLFGVAKRIDYKTLNRYIIEINDKRDLTGILIETSRCLKELLDYRLFSFAVQSDDKIDIWVDPSISKASIEKIIEKDFDYSKGLNIHYNINEKEGDYNHTFSFNPNELQSYILTGESYLGKMYILPTRKMLPYHNEIMNIITKTLNIAFNKLMDIKKLENAAAIDPLTGAYNRGEFNRIIEHHTSNSIRHVKNLSLIMIDIDHFKKVNDTYGHQAGDIVLKEVVKTIRSEIRKGDYLARYGGEEFAIVLPDTNMIRAIELAERLRQIIENLEIRILSNEIIRVTSSFGVATLKAGFNKETLLKEADNMLYKSKTNGRNRVMPGIKLCPTVSAQEC